MPEPQPDRAARSRTIVFVAIVAACVIGGGIFVAIAASRSDGETEAGATRAGLLRPGAGKRILFQNVAREHAYAHLAVAPVGGGAREIAPLVCERAYFAGGRGLCLTARHGILESQYKVEIFDGDFRVLRSLTIPGVVSRARVSADGRYGATTGFVNGHSYAEASGFSTYTALIDMATGRRIANLEEFTATRDGQVVDAVDRNFWGVTFGTGGRFYATMATGGKTYLMEGDIASRSMRALRENVECPSLSPDGTRVAYKRQIGEQGGNWRLHVLDLETGKDTALAEKRVVDDQAEWLDDHTVAYGLEGSVWSVPADGSGAPRPLLRDALSPSAIG